MVTNEWNDYATLKSIEYLAIEYTYIERLITVSKFLDYYKDNRNMKYLIKRWGENHSKEIVKNILKDVIKKRQIKGRTYQIN